MKNKQPNKNIIASMLKKAEAKHKYNVRAAKKFFKRAGGWASDEQIKLAAEISINFLKIK